MRCKNKYCRGTIAPDGEMDRCMLCGRTPEQTAARLEIEQTAAISPVVCPQCGKIIRTSVGLPHHLSYCATRDFRVYEPRKGAGWQKLYRPNPQFAKNRSRGTNGRFIVVAEGQAV